MLTTTVFFLPTFIIAIAGVALWFIIADKNILNIALFVSALILTSLSPTDLFPGFLRDGYVEPLMLKVFPCILIWLKIIWDLLVLKNDKTETEVPTSGIVSTP